ncbi:MAG: hypothetical protein AAF902_05440 [Chloroflexota bacterium]
MNHKDLELGQFYTMRSIGYPIVSCTNQIVALYASKNYDVIPAFISLIGYLLERRDLMPVSDQYIEVVYDYLSSSYDLFSRSIH